MDLSLANPTALVCFGIPLFLLGSFSSAFVRPRDLLNTLAMGFAVASAFVGMFGAMTPNSCSQEWTGLILALVSIGLAAMRMRQPTWRTYVRLALTVYLCIAWALVITGCRQALETV